MPSSPPPQQANSLLNLLNPYASVARSSYPRDAPPESPSTVLLRELQSDDSRARSRSPPTSPTPTAGTPGVIPPLFVPGDDGEDDEPPQSVMFEAGGRRTSGAPAAPISGDGRGDHTPGASRSQTPPATLGGLPIQGSSRWQQPSRSPGPFRRRPSSTSSSALSRHSSPEPDRVSIDMSRVSERSAATASTDPTPSTSTGTGDMAETHEMREPDSARTARPTPPPPPTRRPPQQQQRQAGYNDAPVVYPAAGPSRARPKTKGRGQRKYHQVATDDDHDQDREPAARGRSEVARRGLSGYNKAYWKWANVTDLDDFLKRVYDYYKGKGFWCIVLARILNLLTIFFLIGFTAFLTTCIDYGKLKHIGSTNGKLSNALSGRCIVGGSVVPTIMLVIIGSVWVLQLVLFVKELPRLVDMWQFYTYILGVPDTDIQTMPWPEVVRLIGQVVKDNPLTTLSNGQAGALADMVRGNRQGIKLDAHDIANRILRQENYLIALFNKDLLDLRVRIPLSKKIVHLVPPGFVTGPSHGGLPRTRVPDEEYYLTFGGNVLTIALEWNIRYCLISYLFDENGQVKKEVVRDRQKKDVVRDLRLRFIFMGLLNLCLAPFIVVYVTVYSFFRYFDEYHKNPSSIGGRKYTSYAQWKFREFNELPHLFERRLNLSYPLAKDYIDQFPKERMALLMRFVAFVAGSFAAILLLATLIDPDLFLHFEITPHRTVAFYLGIFASVLAIARGMVPEENFVFDPEQLMLEVVQFTHYLPDEWKGHLHSQRVHTEFGQLFALKVMIFLQELTSVLLTPFVLLFSLPACSSAIVDFFREFTLHVDGLGYVCSFAVFDFERHGNLGPEGAAAAVAAAPALREPGHHPIPHLGGQRRRPGLYRHATYAQHDKMEQSFLHFKQTHPDWQPSDPNSSVLLDRLMAEQPRKTPGGGLAGSRAGLAGSMYGGGGGGGRGLGLGLYLGGTGASSYKQHSPGVVDESRLRPDVPHRWAPHHSPGVAQDPSLATMREGEDDDEDDGEAEALGWDRRVDDSDDDEGDGEHGHAQRGLLKDAGMILQQVLNR